MILSPHNTINKVNRGSTIADPPNAEHNGCMVSYFLGSVSIRRVNPLNKFETVPIFLS